MSSSVELKDTAGEGVKVRYFTSCMDGSMVQENNKCDGLKVGNTINFTITIEVTECPNPKDRKRTLQIYPVGVNEAMTLELDIVCDCPCERPGNPGNIPNAIECNSGGDLECGVCHCDASHTGEHCECSGDATSLAQLESQCKADNATSTKLCSGFGQCVCGKCECQRPTNPSEVISGKYCECDNFSCEKNNGRFCSGNGECVCGGKCLCQAGWSGSACQCRTSNDTCFPAGGGEMCSGNGICKCGQCDCSPLAQGLFCQECPTCPSRCQEFKPCVECKVFQRGSLNQEECEKQCTYTIDVEDSAVEVEFSSERDCSYEDEQKCVVKYVYGFLAATGAKRVRVQKDPVCPADIPVLAIGAGLLGAILLAGLLLLLLYKITTSIYDKRQYAKFLEDQKKGKWTEGNPIYKNPVSLITNPTYGQ